ncbi:MAG: lycopene beta-cyclase CrtY, partial [Pseudomonadota bacterium]
ERGHVLGGNHTWSFHATDVTPGEDEWLKDLVTYRWDSQEVRFPAYERKLNTGYRSIISDALAAIVHDRLPQLSVRLGADAVDVTPTDVTLATGEVLSAPLVIDGRGALQEQPLAIAFQKFYGLEVETAVPHGETHPIIMDATVDQHDGYRFVYTLPMTETRILVEDTYYSDEADLPTDLLRTRAEAYAASKGWQIRSVVRTEQGILPITLAGDIDQHWSNLGSDIPRSGLRAWLFHATTGYSVPYAVRLADRIAAAPTLTSPAIAKLVETVSREVWSEQAFMRLINRLFFVGARPHERVAVMARFYKLNEGLIQRFYAGKSHLADKARVLSGKPPIPITRGLGVIPPERAWAHVAGRGALREQLG